MKRLLLIAYIIAALIIDPVVWAAELNNVTAEGQDGNLVFKDISGNIIAQWDPANRKYIIPSGSVIDIESGGYFKLAGTAVTATAAELNKLASIGAGDVLTTTNTKTMSGKTISGLTVTLQDKVLSLSDWVLSTAEELVTFFNCTSGSSGTNNMISSGGTQGRMHIIRNASNGSIIVKESGQTGVTIASGKTAIVMHNGTDYVRITADATH